MRVTVFWLVALAGLGCASRVSDRFADQGVRERLEAERSAAADDPVHLPVTTPDGVELGGPVPAHIDEAGAEIRLASVVRLGLRSVARAADTVPIASARTVAVNGPEVRLERSNGVTEWWRSLPSGLEHGVTLAIRPPGSGPLELVVEVTGASPQAVDRDDIALVTAAGEPVGTYANALTWDATGALLPTTMAAVDGTVRLLVDDRGATYPVVVDPLVATLEATLVPDDAVPGGNDRSGHSVSVTSLADRALVGAPYANGGMARVYTRTGTTWAREATLIATDVSIFELQAFAVAISNDGTRALSGVFSYDGTRPGGARVFLRTGTAWAYEATLSVPDGMAGDSLGWAVAMSGDGSIAIIGAQGDDSAAGADVGSARVFERLGTTWNYRTSLVPPDAVAQDLIGTSVAISSDGTRALVGVPLDDTVAGGNSGSARVFLRSAGTWTYETMLLPPDAAANEQAGTAVALSADGSVGLVGSQYSGGAINGGLVRVFVRTGTTWAYEVTLLAGDRANGDRFGRAVALSADGRLALVGAPSDTTATAFNAGSARLFVRRATGCPPDQVASAGTVCRTSSSSCDPSESCDGTATECPADLGCSGVDAGIPPDADVDAGRSDTGALGDAGDGGMVLPPIAAAGCACRHGSARGDAHAVMGGLVLVVLTKVRRRRR